MANPAANQVAFQFFIILCIFPIKLVFAAAIISRSDILLPIPGGPFSLGTSTAEIIDHSRMNPFTNSTDPRALMISVYYPIDEKSCLVNDRLSYMSAVVSDFEDTTLGSEPYNIPPINYTALESDFYMSCSGWNHQLGKQPLIIFSHGWNVNRHFYSSIAQSIAKSGYIVVSIDHPYDADIVEFPSGKVVYGIGTSTCDDVGVSCVSAVSVRVADIGFVLDQLALDSVAKNLIPGTECGLDTLRVGMYGHSLGGATAAAAMVNDSRIIGGLNLDGAFYGPVIQEGLSHPFLNFGSQGHNRFNTTYPDAADPDTSWNQTWPRMTGWKLELSLSDSAHNTFSDMPFLFDVLELETTGLEWILGNLKGKRALEIVTTYINAFFGFALRGVESDLLRSESKEFPEVNFVE